MQLQHRLDLSGASCRRRVSLRQAPSVPSLSSASPATPSRLHLKECCNIAPSPQRNCQCFAQGPAASPAPPSQAPIAVELPASQQEAVETAVQCLLPSLQPLLAASKPVKTAKGFSASAKASGPSNRFGIEIPVADPSPAAALDLSSLLLTTTAARLKQRGLAGGSPANWTVVHAREDAAALAKQQHRAGKMAGVGSVLGLREACQQPQLAGVLLLVEPSVADVALVEQLLDDVWRGPAAVLLNPGWAAAGPAGRVPDEYASVVASVGVAYSFLPCAIQGLLGPKEGAVLRTASPDTPLARTPWRIVLKQGEQYMQVGAMGRRPTSEDLELAFINASAASSPLTKTAKFLKGLMPKGKDAK